MKKVLTMVLVLSMVLTLACPAAFAKWEKEVTLFETDFENETVGAAPKTVLGGNLRVPSPTQHGKIYENNGNKYLDTKGGTYQRFRTWFNEDVSSGTIVVEFDLNPGIGQVALGMLYSGNPNAVTTYEKWPLFLTNQSKSYVINGYTSLAKNDAGAAVAPPADIAGKTVTFKKLANNDNLTFKEDTWQHYIVKLDIDNSAVTAYVDGVESATVTGYDYFKTQSIGGLGFYVNRTTAQADLSAMFDNIKIYKENSYGNFLIYEDFNKTPTSDQKITDVTTLVAAANAVVAVNPASAVSVNGSRTANVSNYLEFTNSTNSLARFGFPDVSAGKLYVEFDIKTSFGGIGMTVLDKNDTGKVYDKFVFSSGTKYSSPARGLKAYTKQYVSGLKTHPSGNPGTEDYIKGYTSGNSVLALAAGAWQHIKIEIDIDNNRTKINLDGKDSEYLNGFEYLTDIAGIGFKWTASGEGDKDAYIDNVRVYTASDGKSITNLISGGNMAKLTFADTLDESTIGNIKLFAQDGTAVAANETLSSDKKIVTLSADSLVDGGKYFALLNGVKYADGRAVCETRKEFTYKVGSFSIAIDENYIAKYAKNEKISVDYTVNATDFSKESIDLIVAAYKDGSLTDIQIVSLPAGTQSIEGKRTVELTLTEDCDTISAFAWEGDSLVPCCANIAKSATN